MHVLDTLLEINKIDNDNFLKIKETLTRIGVSSSREQKLFQSCHILHKRGRYFIVHFKEMFLLDGKDSNFSEEDKLRRNAIAWLLEEWNLVTILDKQRFPKPERLPSKMKVLPYTQKHLWTLETKYTMGKF